MSNQSVTKPLPKHRTTQTQNKRINTPDIHALSGFRTDDPSVRVSEDISRLRPRGYCDRPICTVCFKILNSVFSSHGSYIFRMNYSVNEKRLFCNIAVTDWCLKKAWCAFCEE
jgi:hypothetical protein